MLVKLTRLEHVEGFYEDEKREIALDPVMIERIEPVKLQGYDGPACEIAATNDEQPLVVAGTLDEVMAAINVAELSALDKLREIAAILEK